MKKIIITLLITFAFGCSKEESIENSPSQVVDSPSTNTPVPIVNPIDYNRPSYYTYLPIPENIKPYRQFSNWHPPLEAVAIDYNGDGYIDIVETQSDYGKDTRNKILFMKGMANGSLVKDSKLSDKFDGLIHGRKGITGDFNRDGLPDIFFTGHGYDTNPFPGEYPILLTNNGLGDFTETRLKNTIGFFHGAASGDLDNDGDLDIFLVDNFGKATLLENDSKANFTAIPVGQYKPFAKTDLDKHTSSKFTVEILDINNDNLVDIVLSGHDLKQGNYSSSVIFLNSQQGFITTPLLIPTVTGFEVCVDLDFYDLDNDGYLEIILNRTTLDPFYSQSYIQIVDSKTMLDKTDSIFTNNSNKNPTVRWIYWLTIYKDNSNKVVLRASDLEHNQKWILQNGKLVSL